MKGGLLAAAALIVALPASANAAAFMNGGFESSTTTPNGNGFVTLGAGSSAINGWLVTGTSIDYIDSYWQNAEGSHSLDLNGNGAGGIQQTFDTIAGKTYRVTFSLAGNPAGGPTVKNLLTVVAGNDDQKNFFNVSGTSLSNMGWKVFTYDFTADGPDSTLAFFSQSQGAYGPALDAVSVTAIPEPATWAMMIGGVGLVGGSMRRRKAQTRANVAFA